MQNIALDFSLYFMKINIQISFTQNHHKCISIKVLQIVIKQREYLCEDPTTYEIHYD